MISEIHRPETAAALFEGWQETLIWSCLQNVMGHIYADEGEQPASAMALLGDFCFFAGKPDRELALYQPDCRRPNFAIFVPQNKAWEKMLEECYGERARKTVRYAIKKEPDIFDREHLQKAVEGLPAGYTMQLMNEEWFYRCRQISWCRDWVSQYADYETYAKYGLGVIVFWKGEPVAGASSYSAYRGGIEIEIDTREDHRRKGLAYASGARLILECLERGWYPSWDAQNRWSVALAQKLGYHFDHEYVVYEVCGNVPNQENHKDDEKNRESSTG